MRLVLLAVASVVFATAAMADPPPAQPHPELLNPPATVEFVAESKNSCADAAASVDINSIAEKYKAQFQGKSVKTTQKCQMDGPMFISHWTFVISK